MAEGENRPLVSTLNALDAAITSNMAIVPAGAGNEPINAYADTGTQLILDISSYFAPITTVNVATTAVPDGVLSLPYSYTLLAFGGVPPYTWRVTSGALPPGMNPLSSGGDNFRHAVVYRKLHFHGAGYRLEHSAGNRHGAFVDDRRLHAWSVDSDHHFAARRRSQHTL